MVFVHSKDSRIVTFVILMTGAALILLFIVRGTYPNHLMLNELSFTINNGDDWIEIYNPTLNALSLKGYYLSDNRKNLSRVKVSEEFVVPPHGFLVAYGEKYAAVPEGALQLPFSISEGETVYLTAPNAVTIVDSLTAIGSESASVGCFPDGSNDTFTFTTMTPGLPNQKAHVGTPAKGIMSPSI